MKKSLLNAVSALGLMGLVACGAGQSADEVNASEVQAAYGPSALAATKVWLVKVSVLNCRATASTSGAVIFELKKGSVLDTVVGASSVAAGGFTWIKVNPRGDIDHNDCYVAADDRFLVPATRIVAENYTQDSLYQAKSLRVKAPLNCRQNPSVTSPIIFDSMRIGTILDVETETNTDLPHVQWNGDSYWVHVNPRGDTDHNTCWVSAKKANVNLSSVVL